MESNYIEASATGRLDVMGGIADYSGSLVLQMPIKEKTTVRLHLRDDYNYSITSYSHNGQPLFAEGDYRHLLNRGEVDYAYAQKKSS
jgi:L-arabinokinase